MEAFGSPTSLWGSKRRQARSRILKKNDNDWEVESPAGVPMEPVIGGGDE